MADTWLNSPAMEGFLKSALRRAFSRTKTYNNARHAARRDLRVGNRQRVQFRCQTCGEWHWRPDTQVDHVEPVESYSESMTRPDGSGRFDWNKFIDRLFNADLQILCKKCHNAKSAVENAKRKAMKKANQITGISNDK